LLCYLVEVFRNSMGSLDVVLHSKECFSMHSPLECCNGCNCHNNLAKGACYIIINANCIMQERLYERVFLCTTLISWWWGHDLKCWYPKQLLPPPPGTQVDGPRVALDRSCSQPQRDGWLKDVLSSGSQDSSWS
jgi:hypothetical protein